MPETRYTIDPAEMTEGAWEELYNASTVMPRTYEAKHNAKPFRRTKRQIELAIQCIENKIQSIRNGELGPEDNNGDDDLWISELIEAKSVLLALIGSA